MNLKSPVRHGLRRISSLCATAIVSLCLFANPAHADPHVPFKQGAVFGAVVTWAYALWVGLPLTDCRDRGLHLRGEYGEDDELQISSLGLYKHDCLLKESNLGRLSYTPMLNLTHWAGDSSSRYSRSTFDIAAVPMIRWSPNTPSWPVRLDVEFGVGVALLGEPSIGNRQKTTSFQFSDHSGFGISDPSGSWRLGFAFRHLSNLNIGTPNNGANFFGASLEVRLP
jgi:hypothetical protein